MLRMQDTAEEPSPSPSTGTGGYGTASLAKAQSCPCKPPHYSRWKRAIFASLSLLFSPSGDFPRLGCPVSISAPWSSSGVQSCAPTPAECPFAAMCPLDCCHHACPRADDASTPAAVSPSREVSPCRDTAPLTLSLHPITCGKAALGWMWDAGWPQRRVARRVPAATRPSWHRGPSLRSGPESSALK